MNPQQEGATNLKNLLQLAELAAQGGNSEEAYLYFTKVLEIDSTNSTAWFGKGVAAARQSSLANLRLDELTTNIMHAIEFATGDQKEAFQRRGAETILGIVNDFEKASTSHWLNSNGLDRLNDHCRRCVKMLGALNFANAIDPTNQQVVKRAVEIADECIGYDSLPEKLRLVLRELLANFLDVLVALDPSYAQQRTQKLAAEAASDANFNFAARSVVLVVVGGLLFGACYVLSLISHS